MEEGRRLILKDGTVIENGEAGYSQGKLWCYIPGWTLPQAAAVFFDPAKTKLIIFQYGEMEDEYRGFTRCVSLMTDTDGLVSVCMEKAGD